MRDSPQFELSALQRLQKIGAEMVSELEQAIGLIGPMIGVPILHQGRILGSLSLARAGGAQPYTDQDEQRLMLLANQAAVAIQNARQVEELRRLHEARVVSSFVCTLSSSTTRQSRDHRPQFRLPPQSAPARPG